MPSKIYFSFFIPIALLSCTVHKGNETIQPKQFRTEIPFEIQNGKLFILTYWGKNKTKQFLAFDTHAPTWADSAILNNNHSTSRMKDLFFKTRTIDGTKLTGSVYVCDSISLGTVRFDKAIIYKISSLADYGLYSRGPEAVFGDNLISMGIWKIDFENNVLLFASSLDSINSLYDATKLPSEFSSNIISLDAVFPNRTHKKLEVDLGYNGSVILSKKEFTEIDTERGKNLNNRSVLNTLAGAHNTNDIILPAKINIGTHNYPATIHLSEVVKENLLGLDFFLQFKFVILDYKNKAIYVFIENVDIVAIAGSLQKNK